MRYSPRSVLVVLPWSYLATHSLPSPSASATGKPDVLKITDPLPGIAAPHLHHRRFPAIRTAETAPEQDGLCHFQPMAAEDCLGVPVLRTTAVDQRGNQAKRTPEPATQQEIQDDTSQTDSGGSGSERKPQVFPRAKTIPQKSQRGRNTEPNENNQNSGDSESLQDGCGWKAVHNDKLFDANPSPFIKPKTNSFIIILRSTKNIRKPKKIRRPAAYSRPNQTDLPLGPPEDCIWLAWKGLNRSW